MLFRFACIAKLRIGIFRNFAMSQDPEVVEPKETGNVKRTVVEPESPEEGLQLKS